MGATTSSSRISPESPPIGLPPSSSSLPSDTLESEDRAILWEVILAQRCVNNFSNIINAHAIVMSLLVAVTYVGFLQPPKGWNVDSQNSESYMFSSSAVLCFAVFNSLSLYFAISGLLLYIYCSYSTIFTLGSVPLPTRYDERGLTLLRKLHSALRLVALRSVQRRSTILFCLLASSLFCCVAAYICAGLAGIDPSKSLTAVAVILPAILGCIVIIFLLLLAYEKMSLELKFDERLEEFWTIMDVTKPEIQDVDEKTRNAVDPMPKIIRQFTQAVGRKTTRANNRNGKSSDGIERNRSIKLSNVSSL